jgi:hypothetical protein
MASMHHYWLLVSTPLKYISQWEGLSHILWNIKFMFQTTNQINIKNHPSKKKNVFAGEIRTSPTPSDLAPAPAPWQRTPLPRTRVPGSSRAREVQEAAALVQDGSLLLVINYWWLSGTCY